MVCALGLLVLAGWVFDIDLIKGVVPGFVAMLPSAAIAFALAGGALLALVPERRDSIRFKAGTGLAVATLALGVVMVALAMARARFGVTGLLFPRVVEAEGAWLAQRPGPDIAAAFLLSGVALVSLALPVSGRYLASQIAALGAACLALQPLISDLFGDNPFRIGGAESPVAVHTVIGLLILSTGTLCARPTQGLVEVFTTPNLGGYVARRWLPGAIILPFLLGVLRVLGLEAGWFDSASGLSLVVGVLMLALVGLVWWTAFALHRLETRRAVTEAERARALAVAEVERARLTTVLDQLPVAVAIADARTDGLVLNQEFARILGPRFARARAIEDHTALPVFDLDGQRIDPESLPIARALKRGEMVEGEELELRPDESTRLVARVNAAPVRTATGEIIAAVATYQDITAELQARRLDERLRIALDAARMGTWEWDLRSGAITWSAELEEIFGLEPGRFSGTFDDYFSRVHWEDRDRALQAIDDAISGGEPYHLEYRILRPDGRVAWIEAAGRVLRGRDGQPRRLVGIAWDITARVMAQETEARLAAIVHGSDDAMVGKDLDGTITSWNPGAERMYGYTAEEMIGRNIEELVPPEVENDIPAIMERLRRGESTEHHETLRLTKDGRRIHVSLTVSPIRSREGRIIGASTIARDITAQKQAEAERERMLARERAAHAEAARRAREEEALRKAAEALTATVTVDEVLRRVVDNALDAMNADGAFVQTIVEPDREIEVVAAAGTHVPPVHARTAYEGSATERVVRHGGPEAFISRPGGPGGSGELGRYCAGCSAIVLPLADARGVIGSLALVRSPEHAAFGEDEVPRAETFGRLASIALSKANLLETSERGREALRRALESRARLVRGFSHDVKNPLGAAEGQLALLEDGIPIELPPELRDGVSRARRSIRTALSLIDSLIELARAEAGQVRLEYTTVEMGGVVRELVEEYRAAAEARGLYLELDVPDDLPHVTTDVDRVRQVLGNLLSNAIRYTDSGGVDVRVWIRNGGVSTTDRCFCVDVRDTGRGVPEDARESIFTEFTRLARDDNGGSGLGLAIGRRVARLLGGDITLVSEPGKGSTFTLCLPVEPVRREQPAVPDDDAGLFAQPVEDRLLAEQRLLADVSAALSLALDADTAMRELARHVVRKWADWSLVYVPDEASGRIRRAAGAHRDVDRESLIREYLRVPVGPRESSPAAQVLRTGQSVLLSRVPESMFEQDGAPPESLRILEQLGARSAMAVPLTARGHTLGALEIVASESGREYTAADLALAEELGRRAAVAIDNARLYQAAEAASKAKSDFLAVMSHELRTPLTAIVGYEDLLESGLAGPLTDEQSRYLQRIKSSAFRLNELIEEILTFSWLESGQENVRVERIDMVELAREIAASIEPVAREKGLRFELNLPPDPVEADTDSHKVQRILLNLLNNSVAFTRRGEIDLTLEATSDRIWFRISDTGIGIAPDHLERVFDPFWQAEHGLTREVAGTGLGLAIARRLAHMLGGDVTVQSEPGRGSTFTVALPRY